MPYKFVISSKVYYEIDNFYTNVAAKYNHTYSFELMSKNITNAYDAIYEIEGKLQRRNPTIKRWNGLYMATYSVKNKSRWNFAYRIEEDTIFVEDACHAQNMKESLSIESIMENYYNVFRLLLT